MSASPEALLKSEKEAERLAGLIVEDHATLVDAQVKGLKRSLELAFELGEHLIEAKDTCKIHGHGHWEKWFKNHSFKFSLRSAVRFMRLYEKKDQIAELLETNPPRVAEMTADGELSIRNAETLIQLKAEELATVKPVRKVEGDGRKGGTPRTPKAKQPASQPASPDLKGLLQNVAVDEVMTAIVQAWDKEQIENLAERIKSYLAPQPNDDLSIPTYLQRTPSPDEGTKTRRPVQ